MQMYSYFYLLKFDVLRLGHHFSSLGHTIDFFFFFLELLHELNKVSLKNSCSTYSRFDIFVRLITLRLFTIFREYFYLHIQGNSMFKNDCMFLLY